ncbi:hypothetical protein GCM10010425_80680 [Streptomyces spororaveus]|uniref:Uncharacterized protein n=1 Tax=Streptomyces spororaveus TaxID=284039 RepID=A0ABQ3T2X4_9ACTN|nr:MULTISPECIES: hypothetical protein [Streptomyces]MCM9077360.1 hypothetical protein [Streptomyces spororaveus]MCX5309238.1 hypothetical protein [Streptomyces sp. NBC_00160]GHI74734.1 hypothetical protein Sspor_02950 [Streptomyces spororaveus]
MSVRSWFGATVLAATAVLACSQAASAHGQPGPREPHATRISAENANANLFPPSIGARAFLYDAETGKPLVGKRVEFTTPDGSEICRGVTNAEGEAACTGPLRLGTASAGTLTNGYVATFRGDEHYGSSYAFGTVGLLVHP